MNIADWGLSEKGFYCPTVRRSSGKAKSKVQKKSFLAKTSVLIIIPLLGKFIRLETAYDLKAI